MVGWATFQPNFETDLFGYLLGRDPALTLLATDGFHLQDKLDSSRDENDKYCCVEWQCKHLDGS